MSSDQGRKPDIVAAKPDRGPAKYARIGDLDTLSDTDGAKPEVLDIVRRVNHPGYRGIQLYNDIALYKLAKNVNLSPYIRPICLPVSQNDDLSTSAIATGWGHTEWSGRSTNMLQKVNLDIVNGRTCNESYNDVRAQLPVGISESLMLCANAEGKDTCQGDSGGPLQIALRTPYCMYSQIGVTSFGRACASGNPGVYTRVSAYVPWIESIVWPNE
ncbi:hypothetical protein GE061_006872 [Apolygus lucorum]|uniref:Peptidase S1 domain-containing protein n=1 Tax=Apolygus lucorum TaxID=248454 RepID=A0A8S9WRN2_APOLU|nr:hypothetical protein GE061_006872 [Apolygus lucorum]